MKKFVTKSVLLVGLTSSSFASTLSSGLYGGYALLGIHRPVETKVSSLEHSDHGATIKIDGCSKNNSTRYMNHSLFGGFSYYGYSPLMVAFEGYVDGPNHKEDSLVWPTATSMILSPPPSPVSSSGSSTAPGRAAPPPPPPPPPVIVTAAPVPIKCNVKTKFERGMVLGAAVRVGYVTNQNYVLYSKLGVEASRNKTTASYELVTPARTFTHESTVAKWQPALVTGVGVEKHLDNRMFLRAEYNFVFGSKTKIPLISNPSFAPSVGYRAHVARLGLGYRFSV